MNWKNKRILITGCSGVIGKDLTKLLAEKGANVLGLDRVSYPYNCKKGRFKLIKKDLLHLNPKDVINFKPEIVFHLAASFERTKEKPEFWEKNFKDNLVVSHKVIDCLRYCQSIRKFIFASSYLVYDPKLYIFKNKQSRPMVLKEPSVIKPRNLTGAAKYYTEQEIEILTSLLKRKIQFINARIFRVYGFGSRDVVSRWIRSTLEGEILTVYNKENSFDYIYSSDVALGLIKLAETDYSGSVNLSRGKSTKISDVV